MDLANAGEVGKAPVANQVADVVSPSSGREFGDSNEKCGVYAILSLPFDLPHEHIFSPLWTVQLRSIRLCPKWNRNYVGECSIGVVLLLQSSC
ncbi:hypothetical protein E6C27_scaffold274G003740 [Cucumis melo var. makuwa]|uniref:Uncharacterized protein n=1 Tax=Cucumis melo var. makuwa TaxID=1194695 RepID=A0A5A7USE2_CUCMM|nr:hypothetical protein E6C27_scaffold274G003740 [Cucumis melo var. makuwa]